VNSDGKNSRPYIDYTYSSRQRGHYSTEQSKQSMQRCLRKNFSAPTCIRPEKTLSPVRILTAYIPLGNVGYYSTVQYSPE